MATVECLVANKEWPAPSGLEIFTYATGDVVTTKVGDSVGWGTLEDPALSAEAKTKFWIIRVVNVPDQFVANIQSLSQERDSGGVLVRWRNQFINTSLFRQNLQGQLSRDGRTEIDWTEFSTTIQLRV